MEIKSTAVVICLLHAVYIRNRLPTKLSSALFHILRKVLLNIVSHRFNCTLSMYPVSAIYGARLCNRPLCHYLPYKWLQG
ncbi:hypothetical protein RB195_018501 [Necator americanus]|uniref:Secreted protein n=1 Tax=Necator americanus TaxID=51031 RepID=A0ABR1CC03_NECAM